MERLRLARVHRERGSRPRTHNAGSMKSTTNSNAALQSPPAQLVVDVLVRWPAEIL
jgi:hypothetical protein